MKITVFKNGLMTGLILQLAVGPVFFFIINLALQRSFYDGLAGVLAVTLVDYFYITLSVFGVAVLLQNKKVKKIFGIISSVILMIFGAVIIKNLFDAGFSPSVDINSSNLVASFTSVFFLTISSPLTIVFFTSIFAAKAIEYNYKKAELVIFGLGTGFATFLFMSSAVILFSLVRGVVPVLLIQFLNASVGCLLIGYGLVRLVKILKI